VLPAVRAPHLGAGNERGGATQLARGPAAHQDDAAQVIARELVQDVRDAGVRHRVLGPRAKRRQRAVEVEEQHALGRARHAAEERVGRGIGSEHVHGRRG
jgi:hypothetical protein